MVLYPLIACLLLSVPLTLGAFTPPAILGELVKHGVVVDLKSPIYEKGVLTCEEGGVIQGPNIRIQARHITCVVAPDEGEGPLLFAEGDLLVEYCSFAFVGCQIYYDFQKKEGWILQGTFNVEPWFVGAKRIFLLADGSYRFEEAQITTSEDKCPEWAITADCGYLQDRYYLTTFGVKFRFFNIPLFWLPWFKCNLNTFLDHPIRYRLRWDAKQGTRLGLIYEVYSWRQVKLFLRFDWRFNRGPGGAVESDYISTDKREWAFTKSYMARDNSIEDPNQRTRFRFQGIYGYRSPDYCTQIDLSYDKLSDKEMATDYAEKDLELKTGKRTQFNLRHVEPWMITNVFTQVKINSFQTVKQELPSVLLSPYPLISNPSGVIIENNLEVSYLDYQYAKFHPAVEHYHAGRAFWAPRILRPIPLGVMTVTPSVQGTGIVYSNSYDGDYKWLFIGGGQVEANTRLYRYFDKTRHTIEPYASYCYYTRPTVNANNHYIFDIDDGWSYLHLCKMGVRNLLYCNANTYYPSRALTIDTFANAFFDTPQIGYLVPKIYCNLLWDTSLTLRQQINSAWDLQHGQLDHINYRLDWTLNSALAFSLEYRHRSPFAWRKLDYDNFFLDTFRSEQELLRSALSDRRDTLLFDTFVRFHDNWALKFQLRHGWLRRREPNYTEYVIDLLTTIRSIWHVKFSFQKHEDDTRFAIYFNLSIDRPTNCPFL